MTFSLALGLVVGRLVKDENKRRGGGDTSKREKERKRETRRDIGEGGSIEIKI